MQESASRKKRLDVGENRGTLIQSMVPVLYLVVYFLSYSAGFAGLGVCAFAALRGGPRWLWLFMAWLASSIFFMLIRNVTYFLKLYLNHPSIESSLGFYVGYMLTTATFVGLMAFGASYLMHPGRRVIRRAVTAVASGIPLAFIFMLPAFESLVADRYALRLVLINVVMYYAFVATDAILIYVWVHVKLLTDRVIRSILLVNLVSGGVYIALSVAQWFTYYADLYDVNDFSVVNVSLFLMFLGNTFVIGRAYLARSRHGHSPAQPRPYDGLDDRERRIVELIERGATNKEISETLGVSISVVKNTIYRVFLRYRVNSRTELLSRLRAQGRPGEQVPADAPPRAESLIADVEPITSR